MKPAKNMLVQIGHVMLVTLMLSWDALCQIQPKLIIPIGHVHYATSAQFSPDGKWILTTGNDKTARIWDVKSGSLINSFDRQPWYVNSANYSPDGRNIIIASSDNTAKIWDTESGRVLKTLEDHTSEVNNGSYSPDGKNIVTASSDKTAKIWDARSGMLLNTLEDHASSVNSASYSPDGKNIVTASYDNTAKIWDARSGKLLKSLEGHTSEVNSANYSPDGENILTASWDYTAKIWDARDGSLLNSLGGHTLEIISANYSPDGNNIVTASWDETAKIWDAQSGKLLKSMEGHTSMIISIIYSPDGKLIVGNTGEIWDCQGSTPIKNLEFGNVPEVEKAQYSPDGTKIISVLDEHTAKIWDAESGALIHSLEGNPSDISRGYFSPDSKMVVTVSAHLENTLRTNTIRLWDMKSGKLMYTLEHGHDYNLGVLFSPDSKCIVAQSGNNIDLVLLDAQSGKMLRKLKGNFLNNLMGDAGNEVDIFSYSPVGKRFLTQSFTNAVTVRYARNGKQHYLIQVPDDDRISYACFSPDGKRIATVVNRDYWNMDYTYVKIWSTKTGKLVKNLARQDSFYKLKYSPDGKNFANEIANEIRTWDTRSGKLLHSLEVCPPPRFVEHTSYSPDGKNLVSVAFRDIDATRTVIIWNVENGRIKKNIPFDGWYGEINWINKKLITSHDSQVSLTDLESGNQLLSLVAIDSINWVVTHPSGLFDASPGAMGKLYFARGLEIIEFDKLKQKYHEPGLWEKVMSGKLIRKIEN